MPVLNSLQGSLDFDQNCPDRRFGTASCGQPGAEPASKSGVHHLTNEPRGGWKMGRGLLLWLIGIPLPIILVIWLFGGLS